MLHHHLQPERLYAIWEQIFTYRRSCARSTDLSDPQLFFSAKNTKLQFKTSSSYLTVLDVIDHFQAYFERITDRDYIFLDWVHVDLSQEICAPIHHGL